MKLIDALRIVNQRRESAETVRIALACGFTPLHLKTFLHAELQQAYSAGQVEIDTGLFGDIAGTLSQIDTPRYMGAAVVIEWADIDARLGIRQLGGWGVDILPDVIEHASKWLAYARVLIERVGKSIPVAVCLPTLPLPPLFFTAGWQASRHEAELRELVARFAAELTALPRVRLVNGQRLDSVSPPGNRLNVKSEWTSGFPYEIAHASTVAALLSRLLGEQVPKKGIITDLDDTLWRGIVGDAGPEGIWWDLDHHAQGHGLYQQMLKTLADEGVLIAVASKNDPAVVEQAFARADLLLPKDRVFPFEVSWGAKSAAVARILQKWNIASDAVVFIDDNPIELAEVAALYPGIECIGFPQDASLVYSLCEQLRDIFGRASISEEDRLRLNSLRAAATLNEVSEDGEGFSETLLEGAQAEITLTFHNNPDDARSFELINKTNQFNLNGRRATQAEWSRRLAAENSFALTASYTDRFGALGKIAVIAGAIKGGRVEVDTWVFSCRAFARRIEYQCLRALFNHFDAGVVMLDYAETPRNAPVGRFLASVTGAPPASGAISITRADFESKCPKLFHHVHVSDELHRLPAAAAAGAQKPYD